jgi:hypothetical protein
MQYKVFDKITAVSSGKSTKLASANAYIKRMCANAQISDKDLDSRGKLNLHKLDVVLAKTDMNITDRLNLKIALRNAGFLD